ncbi:hypothetical protein NQ318_002148 [Aromia moschata]|uniref:Transposase n=1 Tax=Aromia moschata TaxID=1265417 RepID=A0AAV8XML0_9CUCU|nr:hypothetical protein NQ318_002148 [Aromia moschata]
MSKSKFIMLILFGINGIVMTEWVPEGQTVNQTYYLKVLATLRERVRKKRPELWKVISTKLSWILHQDNAPAPNALYVKRYLAARGTPVLEHAPYSSDLAPSDFFLFPKIKSALKGTRFESMKEVKRKSAELLNALTKEDFQHCFDQWRIRMERCVPRGGITLLSVNAGKHSPIPAADSDGLISHPRLQQKLGSGEGRKFILSQNLSYNMTDY